MMKKLSDVAIQGAKATVPGWTSIQTEAFSCSVITGGLTNKLSLVELNEKNEKALVRIFGEGTDEFIDRNMEFAVSNAMSRTGIAPKVFGSFEHGRTEQFIDDAKSLFNTDLHKPEIMVQVARLMGEMHSVKMDENKELFQEPMTPIFLRKLWKQACCAKFEVARDALKLAALQVGLLSHEIDFLIAEFEDSKMGTVLCHRDLQSGNVMLQNKNGQEKVYLIDFEYSGMDFVGFDYGNFFSEMSINNFGKNFPGFVLDQDAYPSREQQRFFFRHYLANVKYQDQLFGDQSSDIGEDDKLNRLCTYADLGALASSLQWALWGIVQAEHSSIEFGYLEYATARLDQYHIRKKQYVQSKHAK